MHAAAPVYFKMCAASAPVNTSPLAMTGTLTAFTTSRIASQSARPAYICTRVRPWTAMADAPACSRIFATSTQFTLPASQPLRIFTVTGTSTAAATAAVISPASSGVFISAEPSPPLTILPTGQPMLMSIISARQISSARRAPSAMLSGSCPNICAATGRPCSGMCSSAAVFLSL